eukprot:8717541-Pyramimonas_sp.AAC.1
MISTSPSPSQFPGRPTEGNAELPGRPQALHPRQVSQTSLIIFSRTLSKPTFSRISPILGSFARYHRRLCWISNLVQSGNRGAPEPVEAGGFLVTLRSRSPSSTASGGE